MSDLIHEGPKDPNKPPVPGEEKPTTERERMKKVYTYVAILFTVAFLLILWTFLMNQRSINEIKDGNTALQSTLRHGGIPAQGAAAYRYHRRRRPLPRRALPVHCGQAVSGRRKIRSQMVIYFTTITR